MDLLPVSPSAAICSEAQALVRPSGGRVGAKLVKVWSAWVEAGGAPAVEEEAWRGLNRASRGCVWAAGGLLGRSRRRPGSRTESRWASLRQAIAMESSHLQARSWGTWVVRWREAAAGPGDGVRGLGCAGAGSLRLGGAGEEIGPRRSRHVSLWLARNGGWGWWRMEIEGGGWELPGDGAGGDRVGTWGSPMVIFLNKQWWVRTRNG
jgi:hypothetical protein